MRESIFGAGRLATCWAFLTALFFSLSHAASPWPLRYNVTIGPDGPWRAIYFSIDYPDQHVTLLPSLLQTSMIVNVSACSSQSSECPLPLPSMWKGSGAQSLDAAMNSAQFGPSALLDEAGMYTTDVMGLEGAMRYIASRFTLQKTGGYSFLDHHVSAVADNLSVTYPGGAYYTMDTGFFSLYGRQNEFSWDSFNGTVETLNLTLPLAKINDAIPSVSYGLHVGSVSQNISGSIYLGGYDRSRVIGEPIAADSNDFLYLADISVGVTEGGSAFIDTTAQITSGLLRSNESASAPFSARPDPGVPYLYLPAATCDAIAAHLPVVYDESFGLYLWNTSSSSFESIMSSPHYLSFSFYTSGKSGLTSSIDIPFTLLNLTLDAPLVPSATPYFPCRPYDSTNDSLPSVILGRSFLQGAFLAQNWESEYTWIAQAPGPDVPPEDVKVIDSDSTTLSSMASAPSWNETWSAVLKPLNGTTNGTTTETTPASTGDGNKESGLSTGAKAGVGVGVAVGSLIALALLGAWLFRRRSRKNADGDDAQAPAYDAVPVAEERKDPPGELESRVPQELDTADVQELPGSTGFRLNK